MVVETNLFIRIKKEFNLVHALLLHAQSLGKGILQLLEKEKGSELGILSGIPTPCKQAYSWTARICENIGHINYNIANVAIKINGEDLREHELKGLIKRTLNELLSIQRTAYAANFGIILHLEEQIEKEIQLQVEDEIIIMHFLDEIEKIFEETQKYIGYTNQYVQEIEKENEFSKGIIEKIKSDMRQIEETFKNAWQRYNSVMRDLIKLCGLEQKMLSLERKSIARTKIFGKKGGSEELVEKYFKELEKLS